MNDADGDTLTGGGRAMAWDSQNRMTSCSLNGPTSTFTYGADGLRRSMTNPMGVTTDYVYDGQSMIREMQKNASGVLVSTAAYLTGPRGPEYRRDDTRTEPDGQGHTFGVTRWYVYDGLGSVVGEVDPLGNLTCSDTYNVYGAVRGRTGTASTAHGFVGELGHLSDASTGLIYMRARYYDPSTGRFECEDPKQSGNNWFAYCDDNPVNEVDTTGKSASSVTSALQALMTALAVIGAIAGFAALLVTFPPAAAALLGILIVVSVPMAEVLVAALPLTAAMGAVALGLGAVVLLCAVACALIGQAIADIDQPDASPGSPDNEPTNQNQPIYYA